MLMWAPMKTLRESVNHELTVAMQESGVTNAELARRMKRTPSTTLLMLQGERNLTLETLERLLRALGYRAQIIVEKNGNRKVRQWRM